MIDINLFYSFFLITIVNWCYLLLVGVSMKKPIRDNWYIIIIKHSVNESMNGTLLITKKCIRKVLCNFA